MFKSISTKFFNNGAIFVSFAAFLWSLDGVLRISLRVSLSAIEIIFWEHILALILVLPIVFIKWKEIISLKIKDWLIFALIALFASVIATLLYTAALGQVFFVSFSVVVLMQQLQPIWAILSARLILKEKLPRKFIFLVILALFSAYLISFPDLRINLETGQKTLSAALFGLLAGVFWGMGTTFGKLGLRNVSFLTATFLRFFLGSIFASIFLFVLTRYFSFFNNFLNIPISSPDFSWVLNSSQYFSLFLVVIFTGLGAIFIYYYGLKKVQAKIATLCELVFPLSALLIEVFYDLQNQNFRFKLEILSITQWLGVFLLLIVLYKINLTKKTDLA